MKNYQKLKETFKDDPTMVVALGMQEQNDLLREIANKKMSVEGVEMIKGDKGEPGNTPTNEELIQLIESLIPEPIPGKNGDPGMPGKDADEQKIVNKLSKIIPTKEEILASIKLPDTQMIDEKELIKKVLKEVPAFETPTITEIVSVIKKGKLLELRDIKGARLDMGDQRWHGGGISNITGLITQGTNVTIMGSGTSSDPYIINSAAGGGGTPGGLNTQIQYNNADTFGGISGAVTDGTSVSLTGAHLLNPTINGAGAGLATLVYPNTSTSATITFPTTTDTLATLAGTEALTNKSVNGVTLITGGSATTFLNGAGSYTTPIGTVYTGTTNRISVTGTVIDIAATYVGQSSITTLGTITTGVWNGTAIANANLANSTISGVALGGTLAALSATNATLTFSGSYDGTTARTIGINLANANTWTAAQTHNFNAIGTVVTDAVLLTNTIAAAAGAQQYSPALHFTGQGWKTTATAASQALDWQIYAQSVQGTSAASTKLIFQAAVNGGAYTTYLTLDQAANTVTMGNLTAGGITASSVASAGAITSTNGVVTSTRLNITTTSSDGLVGTNTTAATAGVTVQMSPRLRLSGTAWNTTATAASNTQDWIIENLPISGATTSSQLNFSTQNNGGGYTNRISLTSAGDFTLTGNLKLGTAGNGIYVKEGTNATSGVATLSAGTVTVSTTKVTANSRIYLTGQGGTITNLGSYSITARTAGTSFVISSSNVLDTNTVGWLIIEGA